MFEGIGKRLGRPKQDGVLVDRKSFVLNALKCLGISRLSVSKVEVLEGSMEGKHLVITRTLMVNDQEIPMYALINCGAMGIAFMDQDFARHHRIPLQKLKEKNQVEVIDGKAIESGDITHIAEVGMYVQDHGEQLPMLITKLGYYPLVLWIPWLMLHDVAVRFASNTVTFASQYCTTHCHYVPVEIQGVSEEPPEPVYPKEEGIFEPQLWPQRPFQWNFIMLNGSSIFRMVKKGSSWHSRRHSMILIRPSK